MVRRGSDDGWKKKRRRSFEARSLEEKPEGCYNRAQHQQVSESRFSSHKLTFHILESRQKVRFTLPVIPRL